MMDQTYCEEVIISTVRRRGEGIEGDPIRVITEVFKKTGDKIAEYDPLVKFTIHDMVECAKHFEKHSQSGNIGLISKSYVERWVNENKKGMRYE